MGLASMSFKGMHSQCAFPWIGYCTRDSLETLAKLRISAPFHLHFVYPDSLFIYFSYNQRDFLMKRVGPHLAHPSWTVHGNTRSYTMDWGKCKVGSLKINGEKHTKDVVLDRGALRRRRKKASRKFR